MLVLKKNSVVEHFARTMENEETILLSVEETPTINIRKISCELNLSKNSVQYILIEHSYANITSQKYRIYCHKITNQDLHFVHA